MPGHGTEVIFEAVQAGSASEGIIRAMLVIGSLEFDNIRRHASGSYPHECCGVLLGTADRHRRTVKVVVPCDNTRGDRPRDRYNIDPKDLVRIQREGRERGFDIVGFYHSHPDCPAQWSQTDFEEAHWIGCSYVITRVDAGKANETKSFLLTGSVEENKRFVEEELVNE